MLQNSFNLDKSGDSAVNKLTALNHEIDEVFVSGFGLSLPTAKKLGIREPAPYLAAAKRTNNISYFILLNSGGEISGMSHAAYSTMQDVAENSLVNVRSYASEQHATMVLYSILVIAEITVFVLVSLIDIWNNNVSH